MEADIMELVIRDYNDNEFESVKKLLLDSFPEVNDLLIEGFTSSDSLSLDKNKYIQLVAYEDDILVGYLLASKSYDPIMRRSNFWIDYVCVDVEYRGRGIARKLLQKVEDIAREENVLFLQLTSSRFRNDARKLYSDFGFVIRESDIFRKVLD